MMRGRMRDAGMKQERTHRHAATSTVLKWSKCHLVNVARYISYSWEYAGKTALACCFPHQHSYCSRLSPVLSPLILQFI